MAGLVRDVSTHVEVQLRVGTGHGSSQPPAPGLLGPGWGSRHPGAGILPPGFLSGPWGLAAPFVTYGVTGGDNS